MFVTVPVVALLRAVKVTVALPPVASRSPRSRAARPPFRATPSPTTSAPRSSRTDAAAQIIWRAEYEPYGNIYEMRIRSPTDQPLRFPGQEYAGSWEGTEENYNIFRWYRSG